MENYAIPLVAPDGLYLVLSLFIILLITSPGLIPVYFKIKKRELPKSRKLFFVLGSLFLGILGLYIITIPYSKKIELDQEGLSIAAFPYSISVPYTDIKFETLKLEEELPTQHYLRKNGIGLGGFLCGWFSNEQTDAGSRDAFMFVTHASNVISFQTKNNLSILVSPENPSDFIKQMKLKAHEKSN
jgi:hypothetical protein